MWFLTSDTDRRIIYVLANREATIGRSVDAQVCNFAIPDDPSISRKHATISTSDDCLYIQDSGSRYGTFVNDNKVESGTKIKLNDKDVIKFGKMNSVWKVHKIPLVTCTSTLKGENLQSLKLCLGKLGGVLKSEWDDTCAYLTMPAITLTIKVVLALAQGAHIVTTDFWNKCVETVHSQSLLPNPCNYTPQIVESTLNKENVSFLPNNERKTLFAGKTVIFFSRRQMDMYKTVLSKCSATSLLLSETKMTKSSLCEPNVIVIQYNFTSTSQETQAQRNQINEIITYLKSKGKRGIADAEIGLAILYCSTEKYCNPDFSFPTEVMKQTGHQNTKPSSVLALESQEPTQKINHGHNVIINETLTGSKRKLSDEDDFETNANKKLAVGNINSSVKTESGKRKCTDIESDSNPSKRVAVDNENEDVFNFLNNKSNQNSTVEKKLNFTKPIQKKQDLSANDEDDLFNFVQEKKKAASKETSNSIFTSNEVDDIDAQDHHPKKRIEDAKIDVTALRGSKLKELMENNSKLDFSVKNIKKEEQEELETILPAGHDLGEVILKVRADLIVKKEPIEIEEPREQQKNFKKFKKVWPLKKQVSVISKASMSVILPNATNDVSDNPKFSANVVQPYTTNEASGVPTSASVVLPETNESLTY